MELDKKKFFIFFLTLIIILPLAVLFYWPSRNLTLVACNVGQGDAILITKGFNQLLIDGGPDNKVLDCLAENMPFWDKTLELVINTHPEKDHVGGLIYVLERYNVTQLIRNNLVMESDIFQKFKQELEKRKIPVFYPKPKDRIKIAGLELKTLWPSQQVLGATALGKEEINNSSLVFHLKEGEFDVLLTGDIDEEVEKQLIQENEFKDIEVLKVAHHGSKYSTSEEFLNAIKPKIAIISVGKNPWGHPTQEVLQRLREKGIKILRTDEDKIKIEAPKLD